MDDPSTVTVLVLLSIFSIFGTIGNSLVLYIYSNKKEKSTAGIFIMSLAGTDLVTCLLIVPYTEAVVFLNYNVHYDSACKIYMFLITCNIPFAAFIMVAIALDRYFCICHPFLHVLNIQRAKIIILCLMILASTLGVITSLIHGVNIYQTYEVVHNMTDTGTQAVNTVFNTTDNTSIIPLCSGNSSCVKDTSPTNNTANNVVNYVIHEEKIELVFVGVCMPNYILIGKQVAYIYQKIYAGFYLLSFTAVSILYALIYKSIHAHRSKRSKRKRSSLYPSGFTAGQPSISYVETAHRTKENYTTAIEFPSTPDSAQLTATELIECKPGNPTQKEESVTVFKFDQNDINTEQSQKDKSEKVEFSAMETQYTPVTHVNPHCKTNGTDNDGADPKQVKMRCIPEEAQPMHTKHRKFSKAMSIKEKTLIANIRTAAMLFVVTVVFLIAFLPAWLMAHGLVDYNQVIFYMYFAYNTANPFIYAFMNKSFRDDLGKVLKCQSVPMVR